MKQLWWAIPIVGSIALTGYAMSEMQDKAATSPTPKLKLQLSGDVVNEGVPPSPDAFARFACASHKMPDIDYFGKPLPKGRISLIMGGDCTTCSLVPKVLLGHFKTKYPAVFVVQADASRFEKNV